MIRKVRGRKGADGKAPLDKPPHRGDAFRKVFEALKPHDRDAFRRPHHRDAYIKALVSYLVTDYAWLRDLVGTEAEPWVNAIEAIDLHEDKKPLIKLLESNRVPPKVARTLLADLLKRYQLKRRRGRSKIAGYMIASQHAKLIPARERYDELRKAGTKRSEAIERAAKEHAVLPGTLEAYIAGKKSSYRRADLRIKALRSAAP